MEQVEQPILFHFCIDLYRLYLVRYKRYNR